MFHVQVNPPEGSAFGNSCTDLCMACSGNWLSGVREGVRGIRQKPYKKNNQVSSPSRSPPDPLLSPALHIPSGVTPLSGWEGQVMDNLRNFGEFWGDCYQLRPRSTVCQCGARRQVDQVDERIVELDHI